MTAIPAGAIATVTTVRSVFEAMRYSRSSIPSAGLPSPPDGRGASPLLGEDGRPVGSGAGNTYIGAMLAGSRATTMSIKAKMVPKTVRGNERSG